MVSRPVHVGVRLQEETMDEVLTFDQIKARYAPDWVLIGELETDENLEVLSGKVLFHSPDRDAVYHKAKELMPGRFAVQFLGPFPEHIALIL
jgi:hypothetical protein